MLLGLQLPKRALSQPLRLCVRRSLNQTMPCWSRQLHFNYMKRPFLEGSHSISARSLVSKIHRSLRYRFLPRVNQHSQGSRPYSQSYSPGSDASPIIVGILTVNLGVFLAWNHARPSQYSPQSHPQLLHFLAKNFTLSLDGIKEGRYWTLLTNAFSHIDVGHFSFNMIALYSFLDMLRTMHLGRQNIAILALGSALSGAAGYLLHQQTQHRNAQKAAVGASGMVMGVGAAAAFLAPKIRLLLFFVIPMPLWLAVPSFMLFDLYALNDPKSRTAHSGHLGGGIFGGLYAAIFLRRFALWKRFPKMLYK